MPSPLTLDDFRGLLKRVEKDIALVESWPEDRPYRDHWHTSLTGHRSKLKKQMEGLGRRSALAQTSDRT